MLRCQLSGPKTGAMSAFARTNRQDTRSSTLQHIKEDGRGTHRAPLEITNPRGGTLTQWRRISFTDNLSA
ncbi:unnamed protein product [Rodentolepis nana]|uniref:Uncharacterized protein n=1 Tax=Rodentolepis nana TaxID=102285 RepID=A0A0R3T6D7_RODNA|nr:unnamed protein product [Rodentolepis nana]